MTVPLVGPAVPDPTRPAVPTPPRRPGPAVPDPTRPAWDDVQRLAEEVWAWRVVQAPRSRDDIPRQERPAGWAPDFSAAGVAAARVTRERLHRRWADVDLTGADVPTRVDHALLGSTLARVRWELDVLASHERDASFWVDQALGPVFDALLQPPPFDAARVAQLAHLLAVVPAQVATAQQQLTGAQAELAGRRTGHAGRRRTPVARPRWPRCRCPGSTPARPRTR